MKRHESIAAGEHGTRGRYVQGCRCDPCRASNVAYYHDRMGRMRELASTVEPSGPPLEGTMPRGGRLVRVKRCPGASGAPCVAGGAWLGRGRPVCGKCIERVTVWNGDVDPAAARAHLLELRRKGVGYMAVAAASDVPASVLCRVLACDGTKIRRDTERAILAVDETAISDHATVDGRVTREILARLHRMGFTKGHLAELLGSNSRALQRGKRARVLAITEARAKRIERRALAGELVPQRATVEAPGERAWVALMLERGVPARHLSERLGFVVTRGQTGRMWPDNRDAVRALRRELEAGGPMPEQWMLAADVAGHALAGLGWTGDFSVRGRAWRAS